MRKVINKMLQELRGLIQTDTMKGDVLVVVCIFVVCSAGLVCFFMADVQRGFPGSLVPATGLEMFGRVRVTMQ